MLIFVGCSSNGGGSDTKLTIGEVVTGDKITLTPKFADLVNEVIPSNYTGYYYGIDKTASPGKKFLDLVVDVTNNTEEAMEIFSFNPVFIIDGITYKADYVTEESNGQQLYGSYDIQPKNTIAIHFYAEVPNTVTNESDIKFTIETESFKGDKEVLGNYSFKLSELMREVTTVEVGSSIESEGLLKMDVTEVSIKNEITPTLVKDSYFVWSYENENSDSSDWLVLQTVFTNLGTKETRAEDLLGAQLVMDGTYSYTLTTVIVETSNQEDIESYHSFKPLEELKTYFVFEIPKNISDKSGVIELNIGGEIYEIPFN